MRRQSTVKAPPAGSVKAKCTGPANAGKGEHHRIRDHRRVGS